MSTWSSAVCSAGGSGPGWIELERVVAPSRWSSPSARRTATATAWASNPTIVTGWSSWASAAVTASASRLTGVSRGSPSSADDSTASASSGSRKKSPLTLTPRQQPVHHVEVDRDELAAGDLVLTVHAAQRRRLRQPSDCTAACARSCTIADRLAASPRVASAASAVAGRRAPPPST